MIGAGPDAMPALMRARRLDVHDAAFYGAIREGSASSADVIVPLVQQWLGCQSVLDVGCGTGVWLRTFRRLGIEDVLGVDGHHVRAETLEIDPARFVTHDLRQPLELGRRFDLALCLEVAEHLPDAYGGVLVDSLIRHSDQVLFSAGIPRQTGVGHVSGRWQSAWARRFSTRGYVTVDLVRPRIWNDEAVEYWYAQNTLLFVAPAVLQRNQLLRDQALSGSGLLDIVHPRHYLELKDEIARRESPGPVQLARLIRRTLRTATSRLLAAGVARARARFGP